MAIIRFQTNIPQSLHMRALEGKEVPSQYGGIQHMFYADEGMFYVSDKVGGILSEQFRDLAVKPGDQIEITKAEEGSGPGRRTRWQVALCIPAGELPDGTLAVPKLPGSSIGAMAQSTPEPPTELEQQLSASIRMVEAKKAAAKAQTAVPAAQPAWAAYLVQQSNALIDAYSQVLTHASQYSNLRGEDVRSIFLSAFINVSKSGGQKSNVA